MKKTKKIGRPKIENMLREPNGRISRAKGKPQDLAIKIRAEKFNLTLEQAKNPRSQSWVGRLTFLGDRLGISEQQYKAAEHYTILYNNYRKAILSPGAHYDESAKQHNPANDANYEKWVDLTKQKFNKANLAVQKAQFNNPNDNLYAAIQYGVLEDMEMPHLLGSLRIALNALYHHFFAVAQFKNSNVQKITLAGHKYADIDMILTRDNSMQPLRSIRSF